MKSYILLILPVFCILLGTEELNSQTVRNSVKKIHYTSQITNREILQPDLSIDAFYNKVIENPTKTLCEPVYSTGCSMGDGFIDFAVAEIENYSSGCENLSGNGWSQYLELGPAILLPGYTYDFIMSTGYGDQYVTIWIDFNDDEELTEDEKILSNYIMASNGVLYTVSVEIPVDVLMGQHVMRARTNWAGSCNDPCASYTYGEAEDYYVVIGEAAFGNMEGTVTYLSNGLPAADATITLTGLYTYSVTTEANGTYFMENILQGDYTAVCSKEGYNTISTSVSITENQTVTQDFQLTQPTIAVDSLSVSITLSPNTTSDEIVTIENNGNGPLDWSASLQITGKNTEEFMDLQFEYPVGIGGGEVGIETDGNFIYTSKWNGDNFYKYDLDGNYVGSFTISGVSAIRDMAYDGQYFYGGTGLSTVYEMDFENHILVSTFTAPTDCRAIAYNEDLDIFYANNWSTPIVKFDKAGTNLGSFNVGPFGEEYYGFAYDDATLGGPFLWGYAQVGDSKNEIIQIQLPSGTETGFTLDVATKLSGQVYNFAGGMFAYPNLIIGKWTLGGLVQNEWIWGLELADAQTWISISPNSGSLDGGTSQDITLHFDAAELLLGLYEANIYFTSTPDVGTPIVQVTMNVAEGTSIDDFYNESFEINIFPNPSKDKFTVKSALPISRIDALNYAGEYVLSEFPDGTIFEFNTLKLNPGIYILKLQSSAGTVTKKIVIE